LGSKFMTGIILYSLAIILLIISAIKDRKKTKLALKKAWYSFEGIMPQFLAVICIMGITLSIVTPETMSKICGRESGLFGVIISTFLGAITLMPTFVAFSTANILLKNGAGYAQIAAMVSTLTLVGIVTFPLESKYIGKKAAFLRNFLAFLFSFVVAYVFGKVME